MGNFSQDKSYRGLLFDMDYFDELSTNELTGLNQFVAAHGIKVGVVTLEKKPDYTKWRKNSPIRVDYIVGGGDLKVGRTSFCKKPDAKPMLMCAAWLDLDPDELLAVCTKDIDQQAAEAAGIDYIERPAPNELIPLLSSQSALKSITVDNTVPTAGIFGAVCGDVIGSTYESNKRRTKDYDFELFTRNSKVSDDSILTMAIARWLMGDRSDEDLARQLVRFARRHPTAYWGSGFRTWLDSKDHAPRVASSNGSAMRVGPVGYVAATLDECLALAAQSAQLTHNSPVGIAGAQAIAASVFLVRQGKRKAEVKSYIEKQFGFNLNLTIDQMRDTYNLKENFSLDCCKCAAEAITCWLLAEDFEQCIRYAVSLGGDADTIAAMAGAIAGVTPGMEIPSGIAEACYAKMPEDLKSALSQFDQKYNNK